MPKNLALKFILGFFLRKPGFFCPVLSDLFLQGTVKPP